jgi:hypothetical protein
MEEPNTIDVINSCKRMRASELQLVKKAIDQHQLAYTVFSSATFEDVKRADGLCLNLKNIENNRVLRRSLFLPDSMLTTDIVPTVVLCQYLDRLDTIWDFGTEMARRSKIDAIIAEAIATSGVPFKTYCEVRNDWNGSGFSYRGNVDYMIGAGDRVESFLLVVEARKDFPDSSVAQVLAEAGCLLKNRQLAGKSTPVFAILTNAVNFQFFAIDTNSVVFTSGVSITPLAPSEDGTYQTSASLIEILRWMKWFITSMACVSPACSQEAPEARREAVSNAVVEVTKCFRDIV